MSCRQIKDNFSVLDIKFEINKVTKQLVIWRAIKIAQNRSVNTWANCGEATGLKRRTYTNEMFCKSCFKMLRKWVTLGLGWLNID